MRAVEAFPAFPAGAPIDRPHANDPARARRTVERRSLATLGVGLRPVSPGEFDRVETLASLDRVKDEVLDALDALRTDQGLAVRMRVVDERPYPTIARQLAISEQAARARVSRGLRELARTLEPRRAALREAVG